MKSPNAGCDVDVVITLCSGAGGDLRLTRILPCVDDDLVPVLWDIC